MTTAFWRDKRVFITGHTGFKGAWMCMLLRRLGAHVGGYALAPPTDPSLYEVAHAGEGVDSLTADVRDLPLLKTALQAFDPDIVFHMAAQSVVLTSHANPVDTYSTNVMGTVNLFEAIRHARRSHGRPLAVVNVTTDKVYRDVGSARPYRESDRLGGVDPYSNSKACSELVTQAFRDSFFPLDRVAQHGVALASARAGNVIGGGDNTPHQLVPAVLRAVMTGVPVALRNPSAVRPWQHVLDCLHGYLTLAEHLSYWPTKTAGEWNFGPSTPESVTVAQVAEALARHWRVAPAWAQDKGTRPHETQELRLDSGKAGAQLGWHCIMNTDEALDWVADWHRRTQQGRPPRDVCNEQIDAFMGRFGNVRTTEAA